jgi:hypothetical protein
MRSVVVIAALAFLTFAMLGIATPALAQQTEPQQSGQPGLFPQVNGLEPFSAEANFMSLAGYLRWLMFQQRGEWLSWTEAQRVLNQQGNGQ